MCAKPEDVNAFVLVPVYGFVSAAARLDLLETARLARFHGSMFDEILAPDSDLGRYLKVFPPSHVLMVSEPLELGAIEKRSHSSADLEWMFQLFQKSILTAIGLITRLRLYGNGLLQRGDIWIQITFADRPPRGQLSMRFRPTGFPDAYWIGGEGTPYSTEEHEHYRFEAKDLPYFRAFFERVGEASGRPKSSLTMRTNLALDYFNRTYGIEQRALRLVDLVTCLESLLSDDSAELKYRITVRCANLLGTDSSERKRLYNEIGEFYNTRSRLVHGAVLKEVNTRRIHEVEKLRGYVRRVLISLLGVILEGEPEEFYKMLDEMSLDDEVRNQIQRKGSRLLHLDSRTSKPSAGPE